MGVSALDKALGGLVAGTWLNSIFFTIEIMQVYKYFKTYPNDSRYLRVIVCLLFCIDIVSTIGDYACVYLYCVTHWGDTVYLTKQFWPLPNYLLTTGCSAVITQLFLIYRFWRLSRQRLLTALLIVISLTAFGGSIAITVVLVIYSNFSQRSHLVTTCTIWLVTSAVADVCIALALIWQFRRITTSFTNTRSLIHRLVAATVKTGTATSVVALAAFTLYMIDKEANFSVGVAFSLGRIYSLTMLVNLNARKRLHGAGQSDDVNEQPTSGRTTSAARRGHQSEAFNMTGIHVIRTVHIEDDQNHKLDATSLTGTENNDPVESINDRKGTAV